MTKLTMGDVRQVAEGLCRSVVAPTAPRIDREAAFPSGSVKALADGGLLGITVPEEYGGAGLGLQELAMAAEVVAAGCPSTALIMVAHAVACSAVAMAGNTDLHRRLLPDLATGRQLGGFAVHELSSGCMAAPIETRARRADGGFVLSGRKPFVTAANHLDLAVILANLDSTGPSLFAVDTHVPGVSRGKPEVALGLRGAGVAELAVDEGKVQGDALLGEGGDGLKLLRRTVGTVARFGAAGVALGIARAVQISATEHVRSRVTGGIPLGERSAVLAAVATIAMVVNAIESVTARLIEEAARDNDQAPVGAAKAKLFATEQAVGVAREALQIMGGHGYFGAAGIERCLRDGLGLTVHLGPSALLREEVGRSEVSRGPK